VRKWTHFGTALLEKLHREREGELDAWLKVRISKTHSNVFDVGLRVGLHCNDAVHGSKPSDHFGHGHGDDVQEVDLQRVHEREKCKKLSRHSPVMRSSAAPTPH